MTQLECQHPCAPSRRQQRNDDGTGGDIAAVDHSSLGASEGAGDRVVRITGDTTELRGHLEGLPMSEDRTEFVAVPVAHPQDQTDGAQYLGGLIQHRCDITDVEGTCEPRQQMGDGREVHA